MADRKANFFVNLITSGKPFDMNDEAQMDTTVRVILLNSMIFLGASLLTLFGIESLRAGAALQGAADLTMALMTLVAFFILRTNAPFIVSSLMTVTPYGFLCLFLTFSGGVQNSGVLWIYSFPLLSIFLLGMSMGTIYSAVLFAAVLVAVFVPGAAAMPYQGAFAGRTVGVYLLVLTCTIVYEQTKITKDRLVARLTRELKAERDEIAAMKDNLDSGLFLMNRDFLIQPQYSKALGSLLDGSDLAGQNFVDLLSNSLQDKERETLKDYFEMVYNRSFDQVMLDDINPLHQFTFLSRGGAEPKILRATFAPIDREDGSTYILANITDTTREVKLEEQLSDEESKRQEEMRALFEVIHVEPRVLNDFIEDADWEFERINKILKDKSRQARDLMVEIYQGVHAIKSNAVILGLNGFAGKLHALEDELKVLRESDSVSFDDVLHVTFELNKLMTVKDGFRDLIDRIRSFSKTENRMQEEQVLVQTLERVIEKAGADLGKKAHLVVRGIDPVAMEYGPRRAMKEVLMQLVRNAMVHGIESPESREASGKTGEGSILLSIEQASGSITILLTDDGHGLDFVAIRDKAEKTGLITEQAKLEDRNVLLQALFHPGFSTAAAADMHAGRGIGLNLVRERVKELKGSIKLQSEEGKGTSFRISIPFDAPAVGAASAS